MPTPVSVHDQIATSDVACKKSASLPKVCMYGMRAIVAAEATAERKH